MQIIGHWFQWFQPQKWKIIKSKIMETGQTAQKCQYFTFIDQSVPLITVIHTVQKLIVISNKFPRTFDSILSSYVIDAY